MSMQMGVCGGGLFAGEVPNKLFGFGVSLSERGYPPRILLVVILPVLADEAAYFLAEWLRRLRSCSAFVYSFVAGVGFALILLLLPLDSRPLIYFPIQKSGEWRLGEGRFRLRLTET